MDIAKFVPSVLKSFGSDSKKNSNNSSNTTTKGICGGYDDANNINTSNTNRSEILENANLHYNQPVALVSQIFSNLNHQNGNEKWNQNQLSNTGVGNLNTRALEDALLSPCILSTHTQNNKCIKVIKDEDDSKVDTTFGYECSSDWAHENQQKDHSNKSKMELCCNPANSNATMVTNKLNGGLNGNTPWNKFFQCLSFNVFKPKKIMAADTNSNSQSELNRIMSESDFHLYELASNSEILDYQDTKNLGKNLPARAIGYSWVKTFSTSTDGFSLHNLYRKLEDMDSPVIFAIQDIEGRVFGAMLSCPFRISENFYGNSDTYLFRCKPNFETFKWSGDNFYFIQGQVNFISVGSDDGRYGLWLDDNLYMGRTEQCSTFASPPLVPEKDFKIKTVECWTLELI